MEQEFGAYYADFQVLLDILDHADFEELMDHAGFQEFMGHADHVPRRHPLKRGLSHEMLNALAIYPASKDESFDDYVERFTSSTVAFLTETQNIPTLLEAKVLCMQLWPPGWHNTGRFWLRLSWSMRQMLWSLTSQGCRSRIR